MTMLSVRDLEVGYGDTPVLWGISLAVEPGKIVALVGANGAGKTTLLRTIAGLTPATRGTISLDGGDITQMMAEHRVRAGIALVPEGRRLFAGLSVLENLNLGAHLRRDVGAIKRDRDRIFGFFPELAPLRDRVAGNLSGGEQQMCAIGRALMSAPRLLLVDEMSLGLAPVIVERLAAVLATINRESGVTIMLVEQDVELALEIGERGYILDRGRITGEGAADALLQRTDIREAYMGVAPGAA
jgi:branched-chain amino acid transport system ATP-binding protein